MVPPLCQRQQLGIDAPRCAVRRARYHPVKRSVELSGKQPGHASADLGVCGNECGDRRRFRAEQICIDKRACLGTMGRRDRIGTEKLAWPMLGELLTLTIHAERFDSYATIYHQPTVVRRLPLAGQYLFSGDVLRHQDVAKQLRGPTVASKNSTDRINFLFEIQRYCPLAGSVANRPLQPA